MRDTTKRTATKGRTAMFPVRLPHDLRRDLDHAASVTGRSRSRLMFDATRLHLADLIKSSAASAASAALQS